MVILPLMCKKDLLLAQVSGRSFFFENALSIQQKESGVARWKNIEFFYFCVLKIFFQCVAVT